MKNITTYIVCFSILLMLMACGSSPVPKPSGYMRIDLPEHQYIQLDSIYPYSFEYPTYATISSDEHAKNQPYWINIDFNKFKGRLHLSYKEIDNNLSTYAEDAHSLVMKHIPKASAINEIRLDNSANNVHGLIYDIQGSGAASPYQFFATDSTRHFLRGALYFSVLPNNDSLQPVIDFVKKDIDHLLETLRWKEQE
ncbi:MAG: gliding motility lipoprotein GldD [Lentimicrobium sp.]|jgi:gliding motility-associated lipoprotein GldD|nr:gliding motility lipoprotein GldD [Lentimicrobium sp.]